jgi:hypothetical protein
MLEMLETMFSFFSLFETELMVVGSGIWLITGVMLGKENWQPSGR